MKVLKKCVEDERAEKERYRQLANQCKKVRFMVQPVELVSPREPITQEPGDNSLLLLQDNNQVHNLCRNLGCECWISIRSKRWRGWLEKRWVALNPCSVYRLKFPLGWKDHRVGEICRKVSWKVPKGTRSKTAIARSKDYHPVRNSSSNKRS